MRIVRILLAAATLVVPLVVTAPALADTISVPERLHDHPGGGRCGRARRHRVGGRRRLRGDGGHRPGDDPVRRRLRPDHHRRRRQGSRDPGRLRRRHLHPAPRRPQRVDGLAVRRHRPVRRRRLRHRGLRGHDDVGGDPLHASHENTVRALHVHGRRVRRRPRRHGLLRQHRSSTVRRRAAGRPRTTPTPAPTGCASCAARRLFCDTGVQIGWSKDWVVECCDLVGNETGVVLDTADDGVVRLLQGQREHATACGSPGPVRSGNDIYGNLVPGLRVTGGHRPAGRRDGQLHPRQPAAGGADRRRHHVQPQLAQPGQRRSSATTSASNTIHARRRQRLRSQRVLRRLPVGQLLGRRARARTTTAGSDQDIPGADGVFDEPTSWSSTTLTTPTRRRRRTDRRRGTGITSGPSGWVATRDVAFTWEGARRPHPARVPRLTPPASTASRGLRHGHGHLVRGTRRGRAHLRVMARDGMGIDDPSGERGRSASTSPPRSPRTTATLPGTRPTRPCTSPPGTSSRASTTPSTRSTAAAAGRRARRSPSRRRPTAAGTASSRSCTARSTWPATSRRRAVASSRSRRGIRLRPRRRAGRRAGERVNDIITADLDGDGDLDVIAGCSSRRVNPRSTVYENDGTPFVGDWPVHAVGDSVESVHSIAAADLDRDGISTSSRAAGTPQTGRSSRWENDGTPFDGGWYIRTRSASVTSGVHLPRRGRSCRLRRRRLWVDVVSVSQRLRRTGSRLRLANDGSPWNAPWASVGRFARTSLGSVAIADFNGDTLPDYRRLRPARVTSDPDQPRRLSR